MDASEFITIFINPISNGSNFNDDDNKEPPNKWVFIIACICVGIALVLFILLSIEEVKTLYK